MEPTEDGSRDDRALGLLRSWDRLLLCEGLMRTGLVVETDKLRRKWRSCAWLTMSTCSSSSRRSVPTNRYAKAFMSGVRGAERTTRAPTDSKTRAKC